jgi:hypothetical protein
LSLNETTFLTSAQVAKPPTRLCSTSRSSTLLNQALLGELNALSDTVLGDLTISTYKRKPASKRSEYQESKLLLLSTGNKFCNERCSKYLNTRKQQVCHPSQAISTRRHCHSKSTSLTPCDAPVPVMHHISYPRQCPLQPGIPIPTTNKVRIQHIKHYITHFIDSVAFTPPSSNCQTLNQHPSTQLAIPLVAP